MLLGTETVALTMTLLYPKADVCMKSAHETNAQFCVSPKPCRVIYISYKLISFLQNLAFLSLHTFFPIPAVEPDEKHCNFCFKTNIVSLQKNPPDCHLTCMYQGPVIVCTSGKMI